MIKILLVENSRVFRECLRQSICRHFPNVSIEEATSGEEALEKVNGLPPHLIFMSADLPGTSGIQTTRKVKSLFPNIRVAMLAEYDLPEYREAAADSGAEHCFPRESVKWDDVETVVKSLPSEGAVTYGLKAA